MKIGHKLAIAGAALIGYLSPNNSYAQDSTHVQLIPDDSSYAAFEIKDFGNLDNLTIINKGSDGELLENLVMKKVEDGMLTNLGVSDENGEIFLPGPVSIDGVEANVSFENSLSDNYPNPFNAETEIKYSLARSGNVNIMIYNMLGQEVKTLVDDSMVAGTHSIRWDGKNKNGSDVSSGIYFYKLTADDFEKVRKMMYIK